MERVLIEVQDHPSHPGIVIWNIVGPQAMDPKSKAHRIVAKTISQLVQRREDCLVLGPEGWDPGSIGQK